MHSPTCHSSRIYAVSLFLPPFCAAVCHNREKTPHAELFKLEYYRTCGYNQQWSISMYHVGISVRTTKTFSSWHIKAQLIIIDQWSCSNSSHSNHTVAQTFTSQYCTRSAKRASTSWSPCINCCKQHLFSTERTYCIWTIQEQTLIKLFVMMLSASCPISTG